MMVLLWSFGDHGSQVISLEQGSTFKLWDATRNVGITYDSGNFGTNSDTYKQYKLKCTGDISQAITVYWDPNDYFLDADRPDDPKDRFMNGLHFVWRFDNQKESG